MSPASTSVSSTAYGDAVPSVVPVHLTRFVGRGRELGEVERLLAGGARLLTLTGAGGSGKTRLAAEVAARAVHDVGRVAWVDVAPLTDATLVAQQAAAALRVVERPGVGPMGALLAAIGTDPLLLVLDNCEHLVDACAGLAETLLRGCPQLVVLATSREALGVASETAWLVPPLDGAEAVQLFVERAQASLPSFAVGDANLAAVREICRRLDGIPLAIELAAARVRVLSPEQIAERLDDAFRLLTSGSRTALPRHRTLRATMEWSYALLGSRERVLLRRLAVFAGGFTLDAAEAVCAGGELEAEDILDGVAALVDKSLVVMDAERTDARYRLLETVRQYADERLAEAGELERLRERHALFFVDFAELAEPHLLGGAGDLAWLARVTAEGDNLRAAAAWTEEDDARNDLLLRLGVAVNWFWFATGQFREARQRLAVGIARAADADTLLLGRAYVALAYLAVWQGDYPAVRPAAESGLRLLEGRADDLGLATALTAVASAFVLEGEPETAIRHADRAIALVSGGPPHVLLSLAHYWRGWAAQAQRDYDAARHSFETALATGRRLGHRPAMAHPLIMLGRLAHLEGDDEQALARYTDGLEIHAETDDAWGIAMSLEGLAVVNAARGQPRRAVRLLAAAGSLREVISSGLTPSERYEHTRLVTTLREALGDDFARLWGEGRTLTRAEAVRIAVGVTHYTAEFRAVAPAPDAAPAPAASAAPPAPEPIAAGLRVLALGPLQAWLGAAPIDAAAWGSARTRELLVFLLVHPEGVTKEQVGLAFWPEASAAQLRNSFHVTLHRLRRALRDPAWVQLDGPRYRVDPAVVREFDVADFERDVAAARTALDRGEPNAAAALERALDRYRGDFLDGEPAGDWHLEHRARLQRLYVDALMALGARHMDADRPARAAEAYRRVLARDDLHEDATRALMHAHARLGEPAAAVRLYRRFADRLRAELDAEPGRETVELYERLQ